MIRIILITLVLAGCSILPETPPAPSTTLADFELAEYQAGEVADVPEITVPAPVDEDGDGVPDYFPFTVEQVQAIEELQIVAIQNTRALRARIEQCQGMHLTTEALLRAGRLAEYQATLYHQLYSLEIRQGWLDGLMCKAVTGGALLLLATGAL